MARWLDTGTEAVAGVLGLFHFYRRDEHFYAATRWPAKSLRFGPLNQTNPDIKDVPWHLKLRPISIGSALIKSRQRLMAFLRYSRRKCVRSPMRTLKFCWAIFPI